MSLPVLARLLPLWLLLLGLNGCSAPPGPGAPAAKALPPAPDYPQGQALFHGTLVHTGHRFLFTQCGHAEAWPLQDDAALWQQWRHLGSPPRAYVELEGELGLGEQRGAPFRLRPGRINQLALPEGDACLQDPGGYAVRAFGTAPEWYLSLQGARALLTTPARGRTPYQLLSQHREADGSLNLSLRDGAGQAAQLRLSPAPCSATRADAGPGTLWGYRASWRAARQTLEGCGSRGRPLLPLQPRQLWQGERPQPESQVQLELLANYQASLTHVPTRGPQVRYQGVWQPTRDGLELLFNRRQGRGVHEAIALRQQGSRLSAAVRLLNGGEVAFEPPLELHPGALPRTEEPPSTMTVMTAAAAVTGWQPSHRQPSNRPDAAITEALRLWQQGQPMPAAPLRYRYLTYDLNGDGQADALVQLGDCGPTGCDWLIFEGQGHAYRLLGQMTGFQGPLLVTPERDQGWHALLVQPEFARWVRLPFDGRRYPASPAGARRVATPDSQSHVQLLFNTGDWLSLN